MLLYLAYTGDTRFLRYNNPPPRSFFYELTPPLHPDICPLTSWLIFLPTCPPYNFLPFSLLAKITFPYPPPFFSSPLPFSVLYIKLLLSCSSLTIPTFLVTPHFLFSSNHHSPVSPPKYTPLSIPPPIYSPSIPSVPSPLIPYNTIHSLPPPLNS